MNLNITLVLCRGTPLTYYSEHITLSIDHLCLLMRCFRYLSTMPPRNRMASIAAINRGLNSAYWSRSWSANLIAVVVWITWEKELRYVTCMPDAQTCQASTPVLPTVLIHLRRIDSFLRAMGV